MSYVANCEVSNEKFQVSDLEVELRRKLGVEDLPSMKPEYRFRTMGAFWQHWNLHKRKCDKTGKYIISVFRSDCECPVWHKDEWIANADPMGMDVDLSKKIFPQMWELFKQSPIPHVTGSGNENCDYADDVWFSKNCYLTHSLFGCDDVIYSYRTLHSSNCYYSAFINKCELCIDVVNSDSCFNMIYALNSSNCQDSAFLYDCRNCSDCMFSCNLRNKKYCFMNQQLSKEEYFVKKAEWDLGSRKVYEKAKQEFLRMITQEAWHRSLHNDQCQETTGNYNDNCKNAINSFFAQENEDCVNCYRNYVAKSCVDSSGHTGELCIGAVLAQDKCYDIRFCSQVVNSKYLQYSAFCLNCQNCFGCCGLVNKQFYIFNKPYSEDEYYSLRDQIVAKMKQSGEYGHFFPSYMAPNPYDESWSGFHFPLTHDEQAVLGFKVMSAVERRKETDLDTSSVPDSNKDFSKKDFENVYWDEVYEKPFKIREADVNFVRKMGVPLPDTYYMRRIQDNFRMLPFDGKMRKVHCAKCQKEIDTNWPQMFDVRILCEEDYLKLL